MQRYDDLAIFIAVVERGSFIAAANKLKMPSSTVSRRISRLESDLSVKLLERTPRKVRLTEKGRSYYDQCAPHIHQLKENSLVLAESVNYVRGKLKITAPTYLGNNLVADWFVDFVLQYPEIELDIVLSNNNEDIIDEEIDIAIRVGPLLDSNLIARQLWDLDYVLCASPDYLDNNEPLLRPENIRQHKTVTIRFQQFPWRFRHRDSGEQIEFSTQGSFVSNDIRLSIHAVTRGLGIACLPHMTIAKKLQSGSLVEVLPKYELLNKRRAYVVYPSKRFLPRKTQLLLDYIKQRALDQ